MGNIKILRGVFDTPAASEPAAVPSSLLADPVFATLLAKAALCDLLCAVINAHRDL